MRINKEMKYPENAIFEVFNYAFKDKGVLEDNVKGYYHVFNVLPDRCKKVLILRYKDNLTYEKIGENLGVSISSARTSIMNAIKKLRHPRNAKYIVYGYDYIVTLGEENKIRDEKYRNILKNKESGVILSDMEEISVRTYNCLYRSGFTTLNEVNDFIKEKGSIWWKHITSLGVKSADEVEKAIGLYRLNEDI